MNPCPQCGALLQEPWPPACPACGVFLAPPPPPLPPGLPVPAPAYGPAWEQPGEVVRRLLDTTTAVLGSPAEFFRRMPPASPTPALVYAAIVGGIALVIAVGMELALQSIGFALQQRMPAGLEALNSLFLGSGVAALVLVQLGYFLARLFVWSAIAHVLLTMMGSPRATFEATLRVFCYAHAAHLLTVVPLCGSVIALVYFLVVVIIGLSEVHGVSGMQASAAVLAPLLLCCCCCFAGTATLLAPILAALGAAIGMNTPQ